MKSHLINYTCEILPVLHGIKSVSQQEVHPYDFPLYKKKLESLGLFVTYITWEGFVKERAKKNSFPDEIEDNRKKGHVLIYFSKDKRKAELAKKYDCTAKPKKFARLLGYPSCCINSYSYGRHKPQMDDAKLKHPLIAYTPCSKDCKPTSDYVSKIKKIIAQDPDKIEPWETCQMSITRFVIFEKRKWVGITSHCNNRCTFCLDGDIKNKRHKTLKEIEQEMKDGLEEGCTRLILSGGDPTVHPEFIEAIKLGKKLGYKRIQTITNGRMFYYPKFTAQAVKAGLGEITFSIHGHTKELHDKLTGVQGSFEQTVKGIQNAKKHNIIINADIVLNNQNVKQFPEIITFLLSLGVTEFDILQVMPFGRAFENKEDLFYDIGENIQYIRKGFDIAKEKKAVLWTNRFPPEHLENYEDLIQDPHKLLDEIRGRKKDFEQDLAKNKPFKCYGERCPLCCLKDLCREMIEANKLISRDKIIGQDKEENEITITSKNYKNLPQIAKENPTFSLVPPAQDYENYESIVPNLEETKPYLNKALEQTSNSKIKDIPYCFIEEKYHDRLIKEDKNTAISECLDRKQKLDMVKFTERYIGYKKIKSLRCSKCKHDKKCEGIFQKYVMKHGFKQLRPE